MGLSAWKAGFGVLHYSPELSKIQQLNRLDTLAGKFANTGLRVGDLKNEAEYMEYLKQYSPDSSSVDYVVKSMEDIDSLSVEQVETDLANNPDIRVVILDGFNLMYHGSRGEGGRNAMSNTSRKLRQLFSKYNVLGIVVHQTGKESEKGNIS